MITKTPTPIRILEHRAAERAAGALQDAVDAVGNRQYGDARELIAEALRDIGIAEQRMREER
jgi:ABC-type phosphonate transport system ATPase subunit